MRVPGWGASLATSPSHERGRSRSSGGAVHDLDRPRLAGDGAQHPVAEAAVVLDRERRKTILVVIVDPDNSGLTNEAYPSTFINKTSLSHYKEAAMPSEAPSGALAEAVLRDRLRRAPAPQTVVAALPRSHTAAQPRRAPSPQGTH